MDQLQRISPSTSVANLAFSGTPKRALVPQHCTTPLKVIDEENDDESKEIKGTPVIRNPFDVKAESLCFPACSPSVFATFQRNKVDNGSFRWSIEHLSVLYPADIDETSMPETWVDAEQEVQAQKAIDTFFSQSSIVPSPWSSSPKEGRGYLKSRRRTRMNVMIQDVEKCEATTQTKLSIPPSVDLTEILGKYFTFNEEDNSKENSREEADLSTSSLRRKLFVADEGCPSPYRIESQNFHSTRRWDTPIMNIRSTHSTPASDVLSSSPISPPNCSDSCNILSSPPVSPIKPAVLLEDENMRSFINHLETDDMLCKSPVHASSSQRIQGPESFMSFSAESQDTNPFPSYGSEKLDTGYATGSINSFQNMTSSEVNYGLISRITPVAELMEECELSNSVSCDMSYRNDCTSMDGISTSNCLKGNFPTQCSFKTYPWVPTCCSTPTKCTHSQEMTK